MWSKYQMEAYTLMLFYQLLSSFSVNSLSYCYSSFGNFYFSVFPSCLLKKRNFCIYTILYYKNRTVLQAYCGLGAQDLQEAKDQLLVETSDMLRVPLFTAEALLRNHGMSSLKALKEYRLLPMLSFKYI